MINFKSIYGKGLMLAAAAFSLALTSCQDVDLPEAAYSEAISNLKWEQKEGSRQVTLSWTNPTMAGQNGVQVIKNNLDYTNVEGVVSSYLIKKAPVMENVRYTVKATYEDGRVSEGQTVEFFLNYEVKKATGTVAMLVADDYETSGDEKAAVEWFKKNYVDQQKGIVITASNIDALDSEKQAACWVMCDRVGLDRGYQNLPLATAEVIAALKAFSADGGSLFLTNHATQLSVAIGRIPDAYAPGIYGNGEGGQNNDIWGVQPVIGNTEGQIYNHSHHPIYAGMDFTSGIYERSIYCFEGAGVKGDHNCMWDLNAYGFAPEPNVVKTWEDNTNSTVLGTWNHVVDYCCAGIVDFNPTEEFGRVLCVGLASYEWDLGGEANSMQDQLELFTSNCLKYVSTSSQKVAMLVADDYQNSGDEKAAAEWFTNNYVNNGTGVLLTASQVDQLDIETMTECWVMCDRIGLERGYQNLPLATADVINALKSFVTDGGNLLLTNHATQLSVAIGRIPEAYAPGIYGNGEGGSNGDIWGSQPVIGNAEGQIYDHSQHPIYWGMDFVGGLYERSIYCFEGAGIKGDHNCMWDLNAYGFAPEPNVVKTWEDTTNSTVLGTWNHVVDYCCAGIVDFNPQADFKGRVLCVGLAAYEWDLGGEVNSKQDQLELFTANCLNYLK